MSLSDASRPPVPPTLIALLPLVASLCCTHLVVHSGWLLCRLLSCRQLPSACTSASHCTAASHCAPLAPLVRLIVASMSRRHLPSACASASHCTPLVPLVRLVVSSPLVTPPPPPIACASDSHCAAASHCAPLVPLFRLVVASPLNMPPSPVRLRLRLSLHRRLSLCPSRASCPVNCHVDSSHAAAFQPPAPLPLIALLPLSVPLLCLFSGWLSHHFSSCRRLPSTCPPPLIALRLSPCSCCASCLAGCRVASCHATASRQPVPLPLSALPPLIAPLLQSCV